MRKTGKAATGLLSLVVALGTVGAVSSVSCTSAFISPEKRSVLEEKIKNSSLLIGFEGMQPFSGYRIKELVEKIASDLNIAGSATSDNISVHLSFIEKAHKNNIPIYIIGYSSGANDARLLAVECKNRDIPVEILFLLDPTYLDRPFPGKIPGNVRNAVCYRSNAAEFVKGKPLTLENMEYQRTFFINKEVSYAGHMDLPSCVIGNIEADILRN